MEFSYKCRYLKLLFVSRVQVSEKVDTGPWAVLIQPYSISGPVFLL